ncbi:MAG: phosphoribosylaminoimidazolesuccinocarboxamide synthase [Halobacteriales archaeon]
MTSVKEIDVQTPAAAGRLGRATFTFTDAYSVFDWGRMPDPIPDKGASLCTMGAFNFERLEAEGIATHYRGVVAAPGDEPVPLDAHDGPARVMAIDLARVPDLPRAGGTYDYDAFHAAAGEAYVVPLEVIFRNRVPVGSSLRRRRRPDEVGLEAAEWPDESVGLPEPVVEFSTKYERSDRYLDREEAQAIAGAADLEAIASLARAVNRVVTDRAEARGFSHDDGKIEVVYHRGELLVADVVGTFDENRFTVDGQQVSKEVLRQYYKAYDPGWVDDLEAAKAEAKRLGEADWKARCASAPDPLPPAVVELARDLYASGANRYLDEARFDAPALSAVVERVRETLADARAG